MRNPVGWFEIPVDDMERAIKFYEAVFNIKLERGKVKNTDMAFFPFDPEGQGSAGALAHNKDFYGTTSKGVVIYFTAPDGDIDLGLKRAVENGGEIIIEKKSIGEHGFVGYFSDSEGNTIALHSRNE